MTSPVLVSWRDLTFGPLSDYRLRAIEGWDSLPDFSTDDVSRQGGHGSLVSPISFGKRVVTVSGWAVNASTRDALVLALRAGTGPNRNTTVTEELTVVSGGLSLSADARVVRADTEDKAGWTLGRFGWIIQFLCSDPLRYGAWSQATAEIIGSMSGISFPASNPWVFADQPPSGQVVLVNPGTADAPAVFTLNGPLNNPGIDVGGNAVTYGFNLGVGETLVIDTAKGSASFNGAYRSAAPGSKRTAELVVAAQSSTTVQALGSAGSGGIPWVTASFRPAYW